ncbi:MAG: putative bifunctional diguanylate cyclase/phosphodiesterase [Allosphingosinicella sp.]
MWRRLCRVLARFKLEAVVSVLVALTVLGIAYEEEILRREIVILPGQSGFTPYWYGDEALGGGSSVAAEPGAPLAWTCTLGAGYEYPFCGYGLLFNDGVAVTRGIDLSRFDRLTLSLTYDGPAEPLRLQLKNHDPRYSKPGRSETDKSNKVDVDMAPGRRTLEVPLADFTVAEWWLNENRVDPELSHPQFDNIVAMEIVSGPGARLGERTVAVHSIAYEGRAMTQAEWYMAIFGCWGLFVLSLLLYRRRQAEAFAAALTEQSRKTLDSIPQMVWSMGDDGSEYYNSQWGEFTGVAPEDVDALRRMDLVHPEDRERAAQAWKRSFSEGTPYEAQYRIQHRDGGYRWVLSRGLPERDAAGKVVRWYGTCTDVHDQVLATQALDAAERLNRGIIDALPDAVLLLDLDGTCVFANRPAAEGYGLAAPEQLLGKHLFHRMPAAMRPAAESALATAQRGRFRRVTVLGADNRWWDSVVAPVLDAGGNLLRIVVAARDVTEQKQAEEKARWSANHDSLTGLPNRSVLQDRIDRAILKAQADGSAFTLLLIDVDEFKRINDTAGHDAGDALLCTFAERLRASVRASDTVARLGGDEFAVLLRGVGTDAAARAAVDGILAALRQPYVHAGRIFDCDASIGAAVFGLHGTGRTELLKNADVALYAAKNAGKGNLQLFAPEMRNEIQKHASMIALAKDALKSRRILPYYQPKIDLRTGRIEGFEALLRWRDPQKGVQLPGVIAAAFEDLSVAAEISDRMVEGVIADVREWRRRGVPFGHVAINAAAAEFRRGDFADRLLERLHAGSVPVEAIQLEITETVFLGRGAECVEQALKALSAAGIKIALDDFGTGYASLSHLKQFPVDIIKIDQSFVRGVEEEGDNASIIDAVINLAGSLGIEVVAEGIETEAQQRFLVERGCDYGQGFLYSPAVPPAEAAALARALGGPALGGVRAVA